MIMACPCSCHPHTQWASDGSPSQQLNHPECDCICCALTIAKPMSNRDIALNGYVIAGTVLDRLRARLNIVPDVVWAPSVIYSSVPEVSKVILNWDDFIALATPHLQEEPK